MIYPNYSFDLEPWHFTVIQDGQTAFVANEFFSGVLSGDLERILTAFDLEDTFPVAANILLAGKRDQTILVDTGIGRDVGAGEGQLVANLARLGVAPADVDAVIFTHAHWDHIGGAVSETGELVYPAARHFMPAAEMTYWSAPDIAEREPGPSGKTAASHLPRLAAIIETYAPGDTLLPGIQAVAAPGHTVGHAALRFSGAGGQLLHIADAAHHPLQVTYTGLHAAFDGDPEQAVASRIALFNQAVDAALVFGFHFPFPGLGRVMRSAAGLVWQEV